MSNIRPRRDQRSSSRRGQQECLRKGMPRRAPRVMRRIEGKRRPPGSLGPKGQRGRRGREGERGVAAPPSLQGPLGKRGEKGFLGRKETCRESLQADPERLVLVGRTARPFLLKVVLPIKRSTGPPGKRGEPGSRGRPGEKGRQGVDGNDGQTSLLKTFGKHSLCAASR